MKIFVYGTLKRGYGNHDWFLHDSAFLGEGTTQGKFDMIDVGFPMIFPVDDGDRVAGEVYEIGTETLRKLDRLENEGRMYDRRLHLIEMADGSAELCMIYIGRHRDLTDHLVAPSKNQTLVWSRSCD